MTGNPEKPEANSTNNSCKNGWTVDEKRALAAVTFPLIEMQKQYGKQMDAKLVMQGWEIKFSNRYSVQQLLFALDQYTDKNSDFPAPSDLIKVLEPEEPRITEAQFIEAQEWQRRNNNWSEYTQAYETILAYRRQNNEKREVFKISCEKVAQLASSSVNRINQIAASPVTEKISVAKEPEKIEPIEAIAPEEKAAEDNKIHELVKQALRNCGEAA